MEHLAANEVIIKAMFGGFAVYSDAKLCLFLMRRDLPVLPGREVARQNGIYIATTREIVPSLTPEFADAEFQFLKGNKGWIFAAESSPGFEGLSIKACEMIAARDSRIGR